MLRRLTGTPLANSKAMPKTLSFRIAPATPSLLNLRHGDDAASEGVALVEDVRAEVAIEVGRIDAAGIALHRQRAGDRRVVLALAERVGEVEADAVDVAPGELQRQVLVGGVAQRLRAVDHVVARIDAGRALTAVLKTGMPSGSVLDRVDQVDVGDDRQVVALHVGRADADRVAVAQRVLELHVVLPRARRP